ncbi:uncharacterized protein M421DRAFT_419126 [Didymella exigua CBS 183.55]|uniref:AGC-kinase C-terminal domain-containing protein n=1 Tax=Didymella exigua CBS 183.55 TaxID=1150837 RepID=A0A6A5RRL9_9PLEO|nr:uncharacterized protein M421DRAFT_419126 [Didymella exigua CBS 183.55]KAF1930093.1 hypothetical protein M421DRAFT_419126 [Didymella exigua CBS 183.55]
MAPTSMFSYLRPGHAKRNASSLASPDPVSSPAAVPLPSPSPSQNTEYFASPRIPDNASFTSGSPISPYPPQLPPITRVASKLDQARATQSSPRPADQRALSTGGSNSQLAQDRGMLSPPQRTHGQLYPSQEEKKPPFLRSRTDITPTGLRPQGLGISHKPDPIHAAEIPSQSSMHLTPSLTSPGYASHSKSQTSLMSGLTEKLSGSSKAASTPTAAPGKAKSRLRNPMSLLMRRRSGQTLDPLHDESLVTQRSPSFVPPIRDNYDPSIRGNIVHDFNAPRLNRNFSYNNAYGSSPVLPGTSGEVGRVSPPKIEKEHTPVFREHFDDDTSYEQSQAAVRAEQLANNDFVARNSMLLLSEPSPPESLPAPRVAPQQDTKPTPEDTFSEPLPQFVSPPPPPPYQATDHTAAVLSPVEEIPSPTYAPTDDTPKAKKSTKSPPPARSRATSITDPPWQPAGLPAHLSSRASRFSFQINGSSDSTQEHVMEERHRKKAAEKASEQAHLSTNTIEDEYDEYGVDDDFDMDGGYEEEIPMLGEEDEFGGLGDQSINDGISTFDFSTLSVNPGMMYQMSSMPLSGQLQTPYDMNGNPIGFATSGGIPPKQSDENDRYLNPEEDDDDEAQPSIAPQQKPKLASRQAPLDSGGPELNSSNDPSPDDNGLDDDMYFDDGLIGEQDLGDTPAFDEETFDDPEGPLYERKMKSAPAEDTPSSQPLQALPSETGYEADDDTLSRHLEKSEPSLAHKTSVAHAPAGPTMFNFNDMSSYHTALVDAANRAEAAGRFARKASVDVGNSSSELDDGSSINLSRPSLVPDDGRFSLDTVGFPQDDDVYGTDMSFQDDYDYSDYDSALENDPMIAAANAEALAYDDEGFYGSEFGFYAAAGDAQSEWGGVFASGLNRAVSGRNAVREPNLTPITERSEYSTRNSFISLNHFRDGSLPVASPGLAQLARLSPYEWPAEEENMSLDALMKLRKGAFGGSVSSLPSSAANSPRNSSPFGMQFAPRAGSAAGNRMQEQYDCKIVSDESANVADGLEDEEEDDGFMDAVDGAHGDEGGGKSDGDERPESPTLTASDYNSLSSPSRLQDLPPFPPPLQPQILQMQSLYMQPPSHLALAMKSPANIALPMSPFGMPLPSPFTMSQHPASPPPIDTSLSSPTATSSSGPRRQSVGFASPISATSPMTPGGSGWRGGHSRKGSAADSVTYVREHDEAGEGRWVLERRRTAESGELELIGREIVEGGRI